MYVYVEHVKDPDVRFQVMSYDKETHMAKLKGEYGAEFTQDISKEALKKKGYHIRQSEKELPLQSSRKPAAPKAKVTTTEEEE